MNLLRYLLPAAVILGMNILSADHGHGEHQEHGAHEHEHGGGDHEHGNYNHEKDNLFDEDVRELEGDGDINEREENATKKEGTQQADDRGYDVEISGDLRADWSHRVERANGHRLLGVRRDGFLDAGNNDTDIEFNLRLDYKAERTWASAHLQFDNAAGIKQPKDECPRDNCGGFFGSGDCDNICLRRAYMGYNISCNPCFKVDVELGRRGNLYMVFDSKVQFVSRFDGLLLKISSKMDCIDWYLNTAGFLIDERTNHYGWVSETGFYNIYKTSIDFKYSFIWWIKNGRNRCGERDPKGFRYGISQFTAYYHMDPFWSWCRPSYFYGAFVVNHDVYHSNPTRTRCEPNRFGHFDAANLAGYIGFNMGKVVTKPNEWAIDLQYQWVQAKSIPDGDISGIGRGSRNKSNFTRDLTGNTNFHGWRAELLYAITENISLDFTLEATRQLDTTFGGTRSYSKVEVEMIYAF